MFNFVNSSLKNLKSRNLFNFRLYMSNKSSICNSLLKFQKKLCTNTTNKEANANNTESSASSSIDKKDYLCWECGKRGHFAKDCTNENKPCRICCKYGHKALNCPDRNEKR